MFNKSRAVVKIFINLNKLFIGVKIILTHWNWYLLKINNLNFKSMSVSFSYCLTIKQNLKWSLKHVKDKNNDSDRSSVLKRRLSRAFEERKGRGTFIKCTDTRSSTMTDGYSSRESCGEEVFHIPDDISTFICTTCDT